MSLASGIAAGFFILIPGYRFLLLAALFVHLKDILDASDGGLARLKGQTNRIARFLDSLCDCLTITWLITALAIRFHATAGLWAVAAATAAWFSIFLQCSYFNYYLVRYTKLFQETNVRTDERMTAEDRRIYPVKWKNYLLLFLQRIYGVVYGWQDRLVGRLDSWSLLRTSGEPAHGLAQSKRKAWYGDKQLMTLNSPLCFGTHLFVLILLALLSRPEYFYYIVVFVGNAYLVFNVIYREIRLKPAFSGRNGEAGD